MVSLEHESNVEGWTFKISSTEHTAAVTGRGTGLHLRLTAKWLCAALDQLNISLWHRCYSAIIQQDCNPAHALWCTSADEWILAANFLCFGAVPRNENALFTTIHTTVFIDANGIVRHECFLLNASAFTNTVHAAARR